MDDKVWSLIIIGSGPAGLTAAIYASRANLDPLIIEGPMPGGQLMGTSYVENWPGEKKILGADLMLKMKDQAEHFGSKFLSESIIKVDFSKEPLTIWTNTNKKLIAKSIILATGASSKKLNCKGEKQYLGKGITTCAVCDGAFYKDLPIIIVGGGDTAMEEAHFMTKFTNQITIIQILDKLTASFIMQKRILDNPNINIIYNSIITEVRGDTHVTEVVIINQKTGEQKVLKTSAVFVAIGLIPNTNIYKNQLDLDNLGYVKLNGLTNTSVEGVFAAGDVADSKYRQAITSSGTGCIAALEAERYISKLKD